MTSSDSAEDFESADEDFDYNSKEKTGVENRKVCDIETKETQAELSEEVSLHLLDSLKLENKPDEKAEECKPAVVSASDLKREPSAGVQLKPPSKTLGIKLAPNFESLENPEKLEVFDEQNKSVLSNESSKNVDSTETKATTKSAKEALHSTIEDGVLKGKPNLEKSQQRDGWEVEQDKFQQGDGWEVEEEDGFEIPVSLSKNSDGSIQRANEQICALDRIEYSSPKEQQDSGWGGWGSWGVSSLISTATGSVSTFSSQVTSGLSTVLETTVGTTAPSPDASQKSDVPNTDEQVKEEPLTYEDQTPVSYGGFGSLVSGVSFLGSTVINRGLDTLETLGKKTMEVLQEGDPGLMKKRAMLFPNQEKPVLSQILREAKEKADHCDKEKEEKESARKVHFESLFDDFQGMVHLEALEMLSTQCELKLQSLLMAESGAGLVDLQETISQVRDLCEITDDEEDTPVLTPEEFSDQVSKCLSGFNVRITATKIIQTNGEVISRIEKLDSETSTAVHEAAVLSLAEFTAAGIECFHKSAELLLAKTVRNTPDEAESYVQLTGHLCSRVSAMANEFTQLLTKNHPIANSSLITNIFLEASNSCSYIRNACQLVVPILQVGAVVCS